MKQYYHNYYYLFITYRYVDGSHLYTVGSYVFNHYIDCIDTDYYLSADTINSVICLPETSHASSAGARGLVPVLACEDCALRVLKVGVVCCYGDRIMRVLNFAIITNVY